MSFYYIIISYYLNIHNLYTNLNKFLNESNITKWGQYYSLKSILIFVCKIWSKDEFIEVIFKF